MEYSKDLFPYHFQDILLLVLKYLSYNTSHLLQNILRIQLIIILYIKIIFLIFVCRFITRLFSSLLSVRLLKSPSDNLQLKSP